MSETRLSRYVGDGGFDHHGLHRSCDARRRRVLRSIPFPPAPVGAVEHPRKKRVVANKSSERVRERRTCLTVHDRASTCTSTTSTSPAAAATSSWSTVTGQIRIENVRARNTGDGTIGSGHGNVIQLNNAWQYDPSSRPQRASAAMQVATAVTPRT